MCPHFPSDWDTLPARASDPNEPLPSSNYACDDTRPPARHSFSPRARIIRSDRPRCPPFYPPGTAPPSFSRSPPPDVTARRHLPRRADPLVSEPASTMEKRTRRGFSVGPGGFQSIPPRRSLYGMVVHRRVPRERADHPRHDGLRRHSSEPHKDWV